MNRKRRRKGEMFRFRSATSIVLLLCSILGGQGSSAAQEVTTAHRRPAIGVQFHGMWSDYTDAQRVEALDKLAAAGVKWIRLDLGWYSFYEHGPQTFSSWYAKRADAIVNEATARGIRVLGMLWGTPAWANDGAGIHVPPEDPSAYADAAERVAAHFRGRVRAWEVWNEPNHPGFFTGDAAEYAELLKAAYPAFKEGDPDARVVLGGPCYNDTEWLRAVYAAGAKDSFDVMATHPYQAIADLPPEAPDDGTQWRLAHVAEVRRLMVEQGDRHKRIWFTEFGWSSHVNWDGVKNWQRGVSEEQQAEYLIRTITYVRENFPYVKKMFWYNERNRDSGKPQIDNYGLMYRDLSPKPAYIALRDFLL